MRKKNIYSSTCRWRKVGTPRSSISNDRLDEICSQQVVKTGLRNWLRRVTQGRIEDACARADRQRWRTSAKPKDHKIDQLLRVAILRLCLGLVVVARFVFNDLLGEGRAEGLERGEKQKRRSFRRMLQCIRYVAALKDAWTGRAALCMTQPGSERLQGGPTLR